MKRTIKITRYIIICLTAAAVGLVAIKAVTASAETDKQLQEIDRFIETHQVDAKFMHSTSEAVNKSSTVLNSDFVELAAEPETTQSNASNALDAMEAAEPEIKENENATATDNVAAIGEFDLEYHDITDFSDASLEEIVVSLEEETTIEYTVEDFMYNGVIDWNGWRYTYYSEQILPGGGLQIPGRWSDGQFVRDENGYLCVACNDLEQGTYVDTPFGPAIVYDWVGDDVHGLIDIYVSW